MTMELRADREGCSRERLVAVTEGGYDLPGAEPCLDVTIESVERSGRERHQWPHAPASRPAVARPPSRSRADALRPFWAVRQVMFESTLRLAK